MNNLANKKPPTLSSAASVQVAFEQQCTTIGAMSPALSVAFNPTTHDCQLFLEFPHEMELTDAPGYGMSQKVGEDSKHLGKYFSFRNRFVIVNLKFY